MKTLSLHLPSFGRRRQGGDGPGSRGISYALVALAALAIGVAGTFVIMRARHPATPSTPSTEGTGTPSGMPGMPGMPGVEDRKDGTAPSNRIQISPERQQLIGVRTAVIASQKAESTLRTVGVLAYDETRTTMIHTKIAGWVERVYVDYVGKHVARGEPLFSIYSPDLVSTQVEYLIALKAQQQQAKDASPSRQRVNQSLVDATRKRLRLWDISEAQIKRLEQTEEPVKTMTLYSPFDGVVLERKTFAGQYVTPDMETFKIADLSTIWAFGQIFEYELGRVKVGQKGEIVFPYGQTSRTLEGKIGFIYPDVDPKTRTVKLRLEFKNPGLQLKPDSYVTISIRMTEAKFLAVPKEAVIDTGVKQYVLLALPDGYFEPRTVEVGEPQNELYPIVKGLKAGDRVVTSAQFLVDSETNLQAAMKSMSMSMPGMKMDEGKDQRKDMPGMKMP